jgi:hypothetical protein
MGGRRTALHKQIDTSLCLLIADLETQFLRDIFEHALIHLLAHEIDLSAFDARFNDDNTSTPAFTFSVKDHSIN